MTRPLSEPIRIAGAGPSGLTAAITLARAGRRVEVHEAKGDVGSRFIGDLQVIENTSEREPVPDFLQRLGLARNFYFRPALEATFYSSSGRARAIQAKAPYGFFIRRGPFEGSLDRGLLAQAREAGAEIIFRSRLDPARADVIATGPAAPDGLAKEITFESDEPERIEVYFDHDRSPGGYSYLFILDGVATFGCAIVAGFRNIDRYFDQALAAARRLHPFRLPDSVRTGYSYMNFHLKPGAMLGTGRLVGEAGGFQDYLFGLGIRYAITTGHLAARSILEERSYDALWRDELAVKQETSLVNRFLYEIGGNRGLGAFVGQAGRARDFHAYLAGWHESRWWKRLLFPVVRRWWRHDGRCLHRPAEHWCRGRDTEMKVPGLGPVEGER